MSAARRPLLTAAAAGSLLCALWFVPSANATVDKGTAPPQTQPQAQAAQQPPAPAQQAATGTGPGSKGLSLADTGSVDTTPYAIGGTAFLAFGTALVVRAMRRPRTIA